MSGRDKDKSKKSKKDKGAKKTVLPAFGLAEDILGKLVQSEPETQAAEPEKPGRPEVPSAGEKRKYITFFLGKEEYGLPVTRVQEIDRVMDVTRVPNSPEHVLGVMNLRGKIVPVIELKKKLGLGETPIGKDARVVIAEHGADVVGLLVDRASRIVMLSDSDIGQPPEDQEESRNHVQGVGRIDERVVILMDLDRAISGERSESEGKA